MSDLGRKDDGGKLRYDLLPVLALEDVVKGLTFGTIKYDDDNWIKVPEGRKRYIAGAMRHIADYRKGVLYDPESNVHHLSAAIDNLMFIVEKDLRGWEDIAETKEVGRDPAKCWCWRCQGLGTVLDEIPDGEVFSNCLNCGGSGYTEGKQKNTEIPDPNNGWIAWTGGAQPVSGDTKVEVRFSGGAVKVDWARLWLWRHNGTYSDIIAYKILK